MNINKCGFTKYHFSQIITIIIRIKINKITKQTNIKKQNKYINKKKENMLINIIQIIIIMQKIINKNKTNKHLFFIFLESTRIDLIFFENFI